jgi:Ser/Thr protein kinase RdoA (MazF antagonist)
MAAVPSTDEELVRNVLHSFPSLGAIRDVTREGGTAGRNLTFLAGNRRYFLRGRNPKYSSDEEILYDHSLMKYLARKGILAPIPLVSSQDKPWLRLNGRVYELYDYIAGRRFDDESADDLRNAAMALAKYHAAVGGFVPQGRKPRAEMREDHPSLIKPILEELLSRSRGSACRTIAYLIDQLDLIQAMLPDSAYWRLPQAVIHGDFHPANIIFGYDDRVYFTDFDWASVQARARDVSDGIIFFAARRKMPIVGDDIESLTQTFKIDLERSKIFLDAYGGINRLDNEEIEVLPWLIRSRWIQARAKGSKKVPQDRGLEYVIKGVEEPLRWLDRSGDYLARQVMR